MVVHACDPDTHKAEAGGLDIQGQLCLRMEFKAILSCVNPCLKKNLWLLFYTEWLPCYSPWAAVAKDSNH